MKTTYECEKCGTKYDDWQAAYDCEKGHVEPWVIVSGSKWGNGELYPEYADKIIVEMRNNGLQAVYVLDEDATEKLHKEMKWESEQERVAS